MEKELVSKPLLTDQISITEITRELYKHFFVKKISEEIKTETNGEIRLWCELSVNSNNKTDKVIMVFTEEFDGDAVQTKFAFMSWFPQNEHYRDFYDFEIFAVPQSKGWSLGEGSRFTEVLSYRTQSINSRPLDANHPMTDYIALALTKMMSLIKNLKIVQQEFIDHAAKAPR